MKKKITYSGILFSILMVIFFLPMIQEHFTIFTFVPLNGVSQKTEIQPLTLENYTKGTWQGSIEKYISENYGFREPSVRLYNQFLWDCFKKTFSKTIVRNEENWLFEKMFVQDYYESLQYNYSENPEELKKKFATEAKRLYFIQEILKEYGKNLFVLVEPGKGDIYPEHLPENKTYNRTKYFSAVEYYPYLFDSLHVNHIDVNAWFKQMKDTASFNLYPQTGTHWSNIAAAYATDSLLRYMEKLGNINMKNISLSKPYYSNENKNPDADLEGLLNLQRKIQLEKPNQYVDATVIPDSTAVKPRMIVIGDSYLWNISYQINLKEFFHSSPYWYYNSTIYWHNAYKSTSEITDLANQLINTDYIMISYCSTMLYNLGNSFIPKALVNICYNQEQIDSVEMTIQQDILNNAEWKKNIEDKAVKQNAEFTALLKENALYTLYQNPEKYFPELAGNEIPKSRNAILSEMTEIQKQFADDFEMKSYVCEIYSNPNWLQKVKEHSQNRGTSFAETLREEARFAIEQKK
ncbi:MAG: hypothetical protein MJ198_00625 [Bacteroidales bacterium]|nr:hypothetical protein [Bacteroidales bacterium]